jgi:hypothetical protein
VLLYFYTDMVKAAYILLTHEADPQAVNSPLYEVAVNALADLCAELETKKDQDEAIFSPNGLQHGT